MAKKLALIALLAVFFISAFSMAALAEEDVEWVEKQDGTTLYWGDTVTVDGYVIKAEDFNDDKQVFVSISKDGEKLKTSPLSAGLEVVYNDRIKVYAQEVDPNYETIKKDGKEFKTGNWNPYAKLDILIKGEPGFDIDVETKKDTYDSKSTGDSAIDVSIKIKNDGEAKSEDAVLTIDTAGMEVLKGKTKYTLGEVLKDETLEPVNLTLKAPKPWEDTDLNITAKITCEDVRDKKYEDIGFKVIKIEKKWGLVISKVITRDNHMGKPIYVSVNVRNEGLCDIDDIELKDSIAPETHLQKDAVLEKTLSLKSGELAEKVFVYTLIPDKPGEFTFPKTMATFTLPNGQNGEAGSNNSEKVKIYGPEISITKTIDRQQLNSGEKLTVTLTVKNTGNIDSSVTVTDTVPPEAKLISGETSFKQILGSNGDSKTVTYILQMHREGEIHLPACKASFLDLDEYSGEVISDTPVVYVGVPISLEGSSEQPEGKTGSNQEKNESSVMAQNEESEDTPGFGPYLVITSLLAVTCLLRSKKA
ncbi:BatD family protein [Methanosarcina sp. UBA5]|uniref:BatD family protein n=1 Tax=Methanosarcina sp. UBA5 TaxID=1915593 RepID=UPI0025D3F97E|nr:BatD family protein [Methanosarcina sp. UBA5]